MEIINELFIYITTYFVKIFTNFVTNVEMRYEFGFSFSYYLLIVISVNVVNVLISVCKQLKKKY